VRLCLLYRIEKEKSTTGKERTNSYNFAARALDFLVV